MIASEKHSAPAWYLIHCKAKQDTRAEENLVRQGFTCFRPSYQHERIYQGKRQSISESLFPGYLFIQLSLHDNWMPLRSTRGILRAVSFGGQPVRVANDIIGRLQAHESGPRVPAVLTRGVAVKFNGGAFAELEAIFLTMDGDERVVLLMNFLQREQSVSVPLSSITRL